MAYKSLKQKQQLNGWRTIHIGGKILDRDGIQAPRPMRTRGPGGPQLPGADASLLSAPTPLEPLKISMKARTPSPPSPCTLQREANASVIANAWWSDNCYNIGGGVIMDYDQLIGSMPGPEEDRALLCAGEKLKAFGVVIGTDLKANGIMWDDARIVGTVLTASGRPAEDPRMSNPIRMVGIIPPPYSSSDEEIPTPWDYPQRITSEEWIQCWKAADRSVKEEQAAFDATQTERYKRAQARSAFNNWLLVVLEAVNLKGFNEWD